MGKRVLLLLLLSGATASETRSRRKSASDERESSQVKKYLNYCLFKATCQLCNILRERSHCLFVPFFPGHVVEKVSNTVLRSHIDNGKEQNMDENDKYPKGRLSQSA